MTQQKEKQPIRRNQNQEKKDKSLDKNIECCRKLEDENWKNLVIT